MPRRGTSGRLIAIEWARKLLEDRNFLILDTETTGLQGSEILEVAILSGHNKVLFDAMVKPMGTIPPRVSRINHIEDHHVMLALGFKDVHSILTKLLPGRKLVIYNADFDVGIISAECLRHALPPIGVQEADVHDAMKHYSAFIGDWNRYHNNYKWQSLPGGDHSALGDCRATLAIIEKMAASEI